LPQKRHGPLTSFNVALGSLALVGGVMLGSAGDRRRSSSLSGWKRRLLGAVALSALPLPGWLTSPGPAWSQVSDTLPEARVGARRPPPARLGPGSPARPRGRTGRARAPPPPPRSPAPLPATTPPSPFQFAAPTPTPDLGTARKKVPAMVQTLPAADFSRDYSP